MTRHWPWKPCNGVQDYLVKGKINAGLLQRALRYAIERKQAELMLAERAAELVRINELLRREVGNWPARKRPSWRSGGNPSHAMELQERERQLISYEIHDGLVQLITAAKMDLESCRPKREPGAAERFARGLQLLAEGIVEARRLIEGLRPTGLEQSGVKPAIEYLSATPSGPADRRSSSTATSASRPARRAGNHDLPHRARGAEQRHPAQQKRPHPHECRAAGQYGPHRDPRLRGSAFARTRLPRGVSASKGCGTASTGVRRFIPCSGVAPGGRRLHHRRPADPGSDLVGSGIPA